jgi:glycosyltransferase involved in cell wall biosynthesis
MKHLLLVTDAWEPQINGVVTTLVETVDRLRARGWQVTVAHPGLFRHRPMPGYPQISLALNPWRLKQLVKEVNPTHVHLAVEGPLGITARYLLRGLGWRYTTAYHTNFPEYVEAHYGLPARWVVPFVRWFHRHSAAVLVPSNSTNAKLAGWGLMQAVTWGRGFRQDIFRPVDRGPSDRLRLLYVGRVSAEKNIEDFLRLQRPGWELTVVGDGPARADLEARYPEARFVGFKRGTELASFYQQADVFVFPSRSDTLGVVMIEAIACGTPVAAYQVEGPCDVVTSGLNGVLVSNRLERAVEKAACLSREQVAASAHRFSWDTSVDAFERALVPVTG